MNHEAISVCARSRVPAAETAVMYEYRAKLERVVDGDTVDLVVDLGFGVLRRDRFRLVGIDAPEKRGAEREAGNEAMIHLHKLVFGNDLLIQTHKDKQGKYGRYLATIIAGGVDINKQMVLDGHAVEVEY